MRSDQIRERALHDATRLRDALALTLPDIARIARAALAGWTPPDPKLALKADAVKHRLWEDIMIDIPAPLLEFLSIADNRLVIDTLRVAQHFRKRHADVLRAYDR
ncbi:hypothetical protein KNO81_41930 [Paraburkholderia sediminicola]|nr:hypothetical protein [Paraburkholderia sediminicola]